MAKKYIWDAECTKKQNHIIGHVSIQFVIDLPAFKNKQMSETFSQQRHAAAKLVSGCFPLLSPTDSRLCILLLTLLLSFEVRFSACSTTTRLPQAYAAANRIIVAMLCTLKTTVWPQSRTKSCVHVCVMYVCPASPLGCRMCLELCEICHTGSEFLHHQVNIKTVMHNWLLHLRLRRALNIGKITEQVVTFSQSVIIY